MSTLTLPGSLIPQPEQRKAAKDGARLTVQVERDGRGQRLRDVVVLRAAGQVGPREVSGQRRDPDLRSHSPVAQPDAQAHAQVHAQGHEGVVHLVAGEGRGARAYGDARAGQQVRPAPPGHARGGPAWEGGGALVMLAF